MGRELSSEQQQAATIIGSNQYSWDQVQDENQTNNFTNVTEGEDIFSEGDGFSIVPATNDTASPSGR